MVDNNNDPQSFEYDGAEFLRVIQDQRNSALTQAAQLTAVCSRLHEEVRKLRSENDSLRQMVESTDIKEDAG